MFKSRFKLKAKKNKRERRKKQPPPPPSLRIGQWSDIELRQCSPHLCGICDFHGDLAMCDGPCHRQFHHVDTVGEAVGKCPAVYVAPNQGDQPWYCPECKDKTYRCYQCGLISSAARQCPQPYCVRFYCYGCLPLGVDSCPMHRCAACRQDHRDPHLANVVQCLRCPTTWHRGCLAESQRHGFATDREPWYHSADDQGRWMIYCPDHPIDPVLGTAGHDHISWLA